MEDKKSYKTSNSTYIAAIHALYDREPDEWFKIEAGNRKHKAMAVYLDRSELPFLSDIKLVSGDREASLNDFKYALSVVREKINDVIYDRRTDDGK